MPTIAEQWRGQPYRGVASYTQMTHTAWLLGAGQSLFRDCTLTLLREWAAPARPLNRVVDLACGAGDWTVGYLDFAREVVGVEINPLFVAAATRSRAGCARPEAVAIHEMNLVDYDDFEGAELVSLGACMSCLGDGEVRAVLSRISRAQRAGDRVYVRVTVVNRARQAFRAPMGHYRARTFYDRAFREAGYQLEAAGFSSALIAGRLAAEALGVRSLHATLALGRVANAPMRVARVLRERTDFYNYFLRRL